MWDDASTVARWGTGKLPAGDAELDDGQHSDGQQKLGGYL